MICLAIVVGAATQSVTGFGAGLVALPALASFAPHLVPAGLLLMLGPLAVTNMSLDIRSINRNAVLTLTWTRATGTIGGVTLLSLMDVTVLQITCLVASALSLLIFAEFRVLRWMSGWHAAGLLSGLMGAIAGIGGPPLAAAFRDLPLAATRATTGALMLTGGAFTLLVLTLGGHVTVDHLWFALLAVPLLLVGVLMGRYMFMRWADTRSRHAVFLIVIVGTAVLAGQVLR